MTYEVHEGKTRLLHYYVYIILAYNRLPKVFQVRRTLVF